MGTVRRYAACVILCCAWSVGCGSDGGGGPDDSGDAENSGSAGAAGGSVGSNRGCELGDEEVSSFQDLSAATAVTTDERLELDALDDTYFYLRRGGDYYRRARAGGAEELIVEGMGTSGAVQNSEVVVWDDDNGDVWSAPLVPGAEKTLLSSGHDPDNMSLRGIDESFVVVWDQITTISQKISLEDGTATVLDLGPDSLAPDAVADGQAYFCATPLGSGDKVKRLSLSTGEIEEVGTWDGSIGEIALGDDEVFLSVVGGVARMPLDGSAPERILSIEDEVWTDPGPLKVHGDYVFFADLIDFGFVKADASSCGYIVQPVHWIECEADDEHLYLMDSQYFGLDTLYEIPLP